MTGNLVARSQWHNAAVLIEDSRVLAKDIIFDPIFANLERHYAYTNLFLNSPLEEGVDQVKQDHLV